MPSSNLSFRSPETFLAKIRQRDLAGFTNPGATAKRDLTRWYDLLNEAMSEIHIQPVEAVVWIFYVNTYEGYPSARQILEAGDVIFESDLTLGDCFLDARETLSEKCQGWSPAAHYAAWDAAERYQVMVTAGKAREALTATFGMALHQVGLHTYDVAPDELNHIEAMKAVPAEKLAEEYLNTLPEET